MPTFSIGFVAGHQAVGELDIDQSADLTGELSTTLLLVQAAPHVVAPQLFTYTSWFRLALALPTIGEKPPPCMEQSPVAPVLLQYQTLPVSLEESAWANWSNVPTVSGFTLPEMPDRVRVVDPWVSP